MKKKFLNIIVIIFSIILAFIIISPFILSPFEEPANRFFKVDYKSSKEKVIVISWAGCPIGASLSWPLYFTLEKYGNVTYYNWHSDPKDSFASTPGLIFKNYTSSRLSANFIYLYNETLTGNFKNQSITGNLVNYGLSELKELLSPQLYNIAKKYTTQEWISGGYFQTSADSVSPHHINTIIIITGSNGTYLLNGQLYSPAKIASYSDNQLLNNGMNISYIQNACKQINNAVQKA
ncbi:DUF929 domain-containing protein [Ferroplasma sp.]|uniref:DUF929 domain-containing protein n=1 Tax=Ferroplasma sp. TaxID=2591003 RepID=UPI00307E7F5C